MSVPIVFYAWLACAPSDPDLAPDSGSAAFANERRSHWLDAPFPDDSRRDDSGRVSLEGLPEASGPLGTVIAHWADRLPKITDGFCATCPAWFRFDGPLGDLPETTAGAASDPVQWIDLDTGERAPLQVQFIEDPGDDPFLATHTLALQPLPGHAPRSGARIASVVLRSAGARPPDGWSPPEELAVHVDPQDVAIASVWTAQSPTADLRNLAAALDDWVERRQPFADLHWRRVERIRWSQGTTPESATAATVQTLELEGGTTSVAYLRRQPGADERVVDLLDGWPMEVYLAEIPIPYWQGRTGQPWMRFGALHLTDVGRDDGSMDARDLEALADPDEDVMRVIVSVPKGTSGRIPAVIWDHGTGGTAANHLSRMDPTHDVERLNQIAADAGVALVSHDQPFYGTRWPLMDQGFTDGSLGFYNIVNLPAFRDNQRQGGLEGLAVHRLLRHAPRDAPWSNNIDGRSVHRFGHSLGSVTANVSLAADPSAWRSAFLSGPSASFAFNFLQTGLSDGSGGIFDTLADLFDVQVEEGQDLGVVIAAALGIDDPTARARMDRSHPAVALFSWIVDPSDVAAFGADQPVPTTLLMGIGDRQTVNEGTEAMARALPDARLVPIQPTTDLDPHHVLFTEEAAREAFRDWLEGQVRLD